MSEARPASALLCGLKGRCPRCGEGPLFSSGLKLQQACRQCGLNYGFADAGDGPAVFAIFILGFLVLAGALFFEFKLKAPVWLHVALWGVLTPFAAFWLLRVLKATLIALQYKHTGS